MGDDHTTFGQKNLVIPAGGFIQPVSSLSSPAAKPSHRDMRSLTEPWSVSTLHHMVKFQGSQLDRTFAALVDPTRRAILAHLELKESVSIGELARPFAIKLPAVMKHLDVLDNAGLITRSKKGRTVAVRLAPEPMQEAMNWLRRYERFWSASLDRLAAYAEAEEAKAGAATQENTT
jgi:DNA-binding transcriptional ArsR family regulator